MTIDPVAIARHSLAQARAYRPTTDADRRAKADNIRQIERWLAVHEPRPHVAPAGDHPSRTS